MEKEKTYAIKLLRESYACGEFRLKVLMPVKSLEKSLELMGDDGEFEDLRDTLAFYRKKRYHRSRDKEIQQREVSPLIQEALNRIWLILREGDRRTKQDALLRGIVLYGDYELARGKIEAGRFHISCFALPSAAVGLYFLLYDEMERVEKGKQADPLLNEVNRVLRAVGYQAWTQPYRLDETDSDPISVARFRKHVWWVGGNGVSYRPVFQSAIMLASVPMLDVLAKVALKSLSYVSQTSYDDAFWTEGFTADGAGWGHGKQSLIWGYPIHGTAASLWILSSLKGTPWEHPLTEEGKKALFNFLRGSAFFYKGGFSPPVLGRANMNYTEEKTVIPAAELARIMLDEFRADLETGETTELERYVKEASEYGILMADSPSGHYHGVRYFYNNDTLVKKTADYYLMISMASRRCDGIESAFEMAAGYNFYNCDGLTLFMNRGDEYRRAMGGWDLTAWPGVTARQGEDRLRPILNWRGFCSHYNFAGGTGTPEGNGCAGFIFKKLNASRKRGTNDKAGLEEKNDIIYGIKARKGYFIFGDVMLALGVGIKNEMPRMEGEITTTLDQTVLSDLVSIDGKVMEFKGELIAREVVPRETVVNGGFAYIIEKGRGELVLERKKTRWEMLSPFNKGVKTPDSVDIFKLSINHGQKVEDDEYAYYVGMKGHLSDELPRIIANTTRLQAAQSADGLNLGAVFYHAGSHLKTDAWSVRTSCRCVLFLEKKESGYDISLTDPIMDTNLNDITLTVDGEEINVDLPQEPHRGKPVFIKWRKK